VLLGVELTLEVPQLLQLAAAGLRLSLMKSSTQSMGFSKVSPRTRISQSRAIVPLMFRAKNTTGRMPLEPASRQMGLLGARNTSGYDALWKKRSKSRA
jgi:hypothetical protein